MDPNITFAIMLKKCALKTTAIKSSIFETASVDSNADTRKLNINTGEDIMSDAFAITLPTETYAESQNNKTTNSSIWIAIGLVAFL